MALVSTRSLVLQAFPYSETSKILRLFTREHGLRSVIAKGAQRPRSRLGGLLEPFTEGVAHFYLREGRDLHTLGGWDLVRSRQALGRDLVGFSGASLVAELVLRYATEEPHEALYATVSASLDALGEAPAERKERVALASVWAVVSLLGFAPQTEMCVGCGLPFGVEEATRFDVEGGGTACQECRRAGRLLDPASRRELAGMLAGEPPEHDLACPGAHRALLRGYLNAQLARERPLRSLELFLQQPEEGPA